MNDMTPITTKPKDWETDQEVRWCPGCGDYAILAAATVGVALPRLAPGTYTAAWTAEGPDGHKMSGSVSFMVH